MSATAGLQLPSGLISSVSGGGITSGTVGPTFAYPIPVVIVGANGASASGNHSITDSSGILNVSIASGVAVSISGDVILVVSGGTIQVSGTVALASGTVSVVQTSGATQGGNVVIASSGGTGLKADTNALGVSIWNGTSEAAISNAAADGALSTGQIGLDVVGQNFSFNGSTWDRIRTVDAISGATKSGIGIMAAEGVMFDQSGVTHRPFLSDVSGQANLRTSLWNGGNEVPMGGENDAMIPGNSFTFQTTSKIFNGTNWDRIRSAIGASGMAAASGEILAAAITAVSPGGSGQFMPLNATSGILSVGTSGSANVIMALSGGTSVVNIPVGVLSGVISIQSGNVSVSSGQVIITSGGTIPHYIAGYTYNRITNSGIHNVQSGASVLHTVTINSWLSGVALQINDSLSGTTGTVVAVIGGNADLVTATSLPTTLTYDALMLSGISILAAVSGFDATVTFRNPP